MNPPVAPFLLTSIIFYYCIYGKEHTYTLSKMSYTFLTFCKGFLTASFPRRKFFRFPKHFILLLK
ncbi:hypothetical protein CW304_16520 [Bacillus sp. UFRGS-B20]|nr:hypothetical protein CW304_16520 [Bacillus sp. UFRGS-B20]